MTLKGLQKHISAILESALTLIMKLTPLLTLLAALFFFIGCGSSESSDGSTGAQKMGEEAGDPSTANTAEDGLLMDQYLSGEIPGLNDEQ